MRKPQTTKGPDVEILRVQNEVTDGLYDGEPSTQEQYTTMDPNSFNQRILLVVTGLTPQIVTETLYKLSVDCSPSFIPTEIHLITTEKGEQSAKVALLGVDGQSGELQRLCEEYALPEIAFGPENIHVIPETATEFSSDNESRIHNIIASDFITRVVHRFTSDETSALHISLAGGRKTMSYYAGYALSLYGRIQDRLSHVMVNEPFQSNKDFFFPPAKPRSFETNNRWYSTSDANIVLSDIPYVRLRYHIPRTLLTGDSGFQETVTIIQRFLGPPSISADRDSECIVINDQTIKLERAKFVLYLWFCSRRKNNLPPVIKDPPTASPADNQSYIIEPFLAHYKKLYGDGSGMLERTESVISGSDTQVKKTGATLHKAERSWFGPHRTLINKAIKEKLGERFAKPFLIDVIERDNITGYDIDVPPEAINIPFNPSAGARRT